MVDGFILESYICVKWTVLLTENINPDNYNHLVMQCPSCKSSTGLPKATGFLKLLQYLDIPNRD